MVIIFILHLYLNFIILIGSTVHNLNQNLKNFCFFSENFDLRQFFYAFRAEFFKYYKIHIKSKFMRFGFKK
jgi:hypothetical protein